MVHARVLVLLQLRELILPYVNHVGDWLLVLCNVCLMLNLSDETGIGLAMDTSDMTSYGQIQSEEVRSRDLTCR